MDQLIHCDRAAPIEVNHQSESSGPEWQSCVHNGLESEQTKRQHEVDQYQVLAGCPIFVKSPEDVVEGQWDEAFAQDPLFEVLTES
jgi:hypothetical protein